MVAFWLMAIASSCLLVRLPGPARRRIDVHPEHRHLGAGDVGQLIARKLQQHPEYAVRLVGFVDVSRRSRDGHRRPPTTGFPRATAGARPKFEIDRVIIAYSNDSNEDMLALVHKLKARSVHIDVVPRLFDAVGPRVDVHSIEGLPLIGLPIVRLSPSSRTTSARWISSSLA